MSTEHSDPTSQGTYGAAARAKRQPTAGQALHKALLQLLVCQLAFTVSMLRFFMIVDSLLMMMTGGWGGGELAKKVSLFALKTEMTEYKSSVSMLLLTVSLKKKIRASKSDLENLKRERRALRTRPLPQIKPGFRCNSIYPNTKTFSTISLWSLQTMSWQHSKYFTVWVMLQQLQLGLWNPWRCGCSNQHHHGLLWRNVLQLFQGDDSSHPSSMPPSLVTGKTTSAWLGGTIVRLTFTDDTHQFWNRTKAQLSSTQIQKD